MAPLLPYQRRAGLVHLDGFYDRGLRVEGRASRGRGVGSDCGPRWEQLHLRTYRWVFVHGHRRCERWNQGRRCLYGDGF